MSELHLCPSCEMVAMEVFHKLDAIPVNSCIQLDSRKEAVEYPTGQLKLAFCNQCGFIANIAFDAKLTEYSGRYEETQGYSEIFNEFHRKLAQRLIDDHQLHGKEIVEIGCGKGEFLILLCEIGQNKGIGFDPGYQEGRISSPVLKNIRFIRDFYSEQYTGYGGHFICCKMTLEHIDSTCEFVSMVRRSIADRTDVVVFFQVPNTTRILREVAFEDIYYEHCSYFCAGSLNRLFKKCGFNVIRTQTEYDDQYLTIEATPAHDTAPKTADQRDDVVQLRAHVLDFQKRYQLKIRQWRDKLEEFRTNKKKVVLWGSGSKAVAFMTSVNATDIHYIVDVNPHRQGHFMPVTGQEIVSTNFLTGHDPEIVIIMNGIYLAEIKKMLDRQGLTPELLTL